MRERIVGIPKTAAVVGELMDEVVECGADVSPRHSRVLVTCSSRHRRQTRNVENRTRSNQSSPSAGRSEVRWTDRPTNRLTDCLIIPDLYADLSRTGFGHVRCQVFSCVAKLQL